MATEFPVPGTPPSAPRPAGSSFWQRASPLLSIASLLAVGALWDRYDAAIADLTTSQRQLAEDVASQRNSPFIDVSKSPFLGSPDALATFIEYPTTSVRSASGTPGRRCRRLTRTSFRPARFGTCSRTSQSTSCTPTPSARMRPAAVRRRRTSSGSCTTCSSVRRALTRARSSNSARRRRTSAWGRSARASTAAARRPRFTRRSRNQRPRRAGHARLLPGDADSETNQVRVSRAISGAQPYEVFEQALRTLVGK